VIVSWSEREVQLDSKHDGKLSGISVLVVEDDQDTRDLLGLLLTNKGATVTSAETVPKALDTLIE